MKLCLSSSGCETRPARGEPARPVVSLAPCPVMGRAKRRRTSEWAVGVSPEIYVIPGAQGVGTPEGSSDPSVTGRGWVAPGEVVGHGTLEEDDAVTREALSILGQIRCSGEPGKDLRRAACQRTHMRPIKNEGSHRGRPKARADHSRGRSGHGSRRAEYERRRRGTRWRADPAEQRQPVLT